MYAKEEDDPLGDKILSLSNFLIYLGIDCTIDHYHANDNIPNWPTWVTNQIEEHIVSVNGNVLFVCSETMKRLLDNIPDTKNSQIGMAYGHIDRLTLENFLHGDYTSKFLPMLIDHDEDISLVPHCLQKGNIYRFNYKALNNDIDHQTILEHSDFSSLRSLIATISGQQENPQPNNNSSKTEQTLC